jgi:DegV family protein with EDD domain
MSKVAIVTDSVACLPKSLIDQYNIEIVPFTILSNGKTYRDGVDVTPTQAYELFKKEPDAFRTTPYTPEDCLTVFRKLSSKSENILFITVSVKISTSINVAKLAKEKAKAELPGTRIELLDSETAAAAQGFVVLAAARAAVSGKNFEEIIEAAKQIKERVHAVILLDTVRYVYRSGRVPKIAAQAASVLNIHPIFNLYGAVNFITAARTKKSGIDRLLQMMEEKIDQRPIHCAVMHAYDPEGAEKLKAQVAEKFNIKELWVGEFSPIMGYATGSGTLGLAFYSET